MTSFRILGPIEAWCETRHLSIGGPRQVTLLAFLLSRANRAVSSDALTDAIWGSARSGADNRLQMAVARLRRSLAPLDGLSGPPLRTIQGGYLLSLGSDQLDAEVFAERVQDGLRAVHAGEPALAVMVLSDALALWRGPPLAEVAYEDFAQGEIRRLEELRRAAIETRIDAELRLGRHRELLGELGRMLVEHPMCERITAQLMLALYRSDRQADALEVYDRTRVELSKQLGLEPGPPLKALQANILAHAPSLKQSTSTDSGSARGASAQLPSAPALRDTHWPGSIDSEKHSSATSRTRAHSCSMYTPVTTAIRWRGSSKPWYRESWTAPRRSQAGDGHQRLNTAA